MLLNGVSADARSELPDQLLDIGNAGLADALAATIHRRLSLTQLRESLDALATTTGATTWALDRRQPS